MTIICNNENCTQWNVLRE